MGLIQNMLAQWKDKKEEKKHMEQVSRWEDNIEERKLSHEERSLNKYLEEERQKKIKVLLAIKKKKEMDEVWRGKTYNPVFAKNMFANEKSIFDHKARMMKGQSNLLKQKNLFKK